jgi:hypothetical protein
MMMQQQFMSVLHLLLVQAWPRVIVFAGCRLACASNLCWMLWVPLDISVLHPAPVALSATSAEHHHARATASVDAVKLYRQKGYPGS